MAVDAWIAVRTDAVRVFVCLSIYLAEVRSKKKKVVCRITD